MSSTIRERRAVITAETTAISTPLKQKISPTAITVIVCDDEKDILNILARALRQKFHVVTASSGNECIEKCKEISTANRESIRLLLLLDYKLGDMMGDEVAYKVSEVSNHMKILLMTAYELDLAFIDDLKAQGYISGLIRKPFHLAHVISRIEDEVCSS
jgi:DNA-binding response OmpR family regulator